MRKILCIIAILLSFSLSPLCGMPLLTLSELSQSVSLATGGSGQLTLRGQSRDAQFSIYSITGQQVRSLKVAAGAKVTIDLPKGFYIVKSGGRSQKVVVR